LVYAGIFKPTDSMSNGTIFEVPDDNANLIQRLRCSGNYEEVREFKKITNPKKEKKEKKKEEK
jgi:hypothetical protein